MSDGSSSTGSTATNNNGSSSDDIVVAAPPVNEKHVVVSTRRRESLAAPSGLLTTTTALVSRENGRYRLLSLPQTNGIPIVAIAFLDIANSADFPANVFNQIPVPKFAAVLMAIGATFALVMSGVAFVDARRSWRNIAMLRRERQELLAGERGRGEESDSDDHVAAPDITLLSLNQRDIRTEFFERAGMETIMGFASFLIAVGTYMAIGGANHRVYLASNLLSGYIGNTPTAAYGVINTAWSVIAWHRARMQQRSAYSILSPGKVKDALVRRTSTITRHAIISAITCLVSGALGLLTPIYWQPYPVLAVCGLLFMHTTWVFRHRVAYNRPLISADTRALIAGDIATELDDLLSIHAEVKKDKNFLAETVESATNDAGREKATPERLFATNFRTIVKLGMFEDFCRQVFANDQLSPKLCAEWGDVVKVTPAYFLALDKLHQPLDEICRNILIKRGRKAVSVRVRFLLEALGTCLVTMKKGSAPEPPA